VTTDLIYIENYTVDRSQNANRYNLNMQDTNNYTVGDDDGDGLINEDPPDGVDNDGDGNIDEDGLPWDYLNLGYQVTGSEPVIIPQFATEFEGVILKVLPSIGINGKIITLTLQPEVSEKVGEEIFNLVIPDYEGTAEIKRPIMNRRTFATQLSIEDGCTVVLGGLKREKDIMKVSRVPLLGNIPILGRLFSRTYSTTLSTNLLIFVTAHILDPSGSTYKKAASPKKVVTFQNPDGTPLTPREVKEHLNRGK
jgi:type II secretory pathway component GspD/PulD (secretin)